MGRHREMHKELLLSASSSRSTSSSGLRCPDVSAKLMPVLHHSACCCHRTKYRPICDVFLPSLGFPLLLSRLPFIALLSSLNHFVEE